MNVKMSKLVTVCADMGTKKNKLFTGGWGQTQWSTKQGERNNGALTENQHVKDLSENTHLMKLCNF